jgi:hypothetical protein
MTSRRILTGLGLLAPAALLSSQPASPLAARPGAMLGKLEIGQWVVKPYDKGSAKRSLCVRNPAALIQIEHGGGCRHDVLSSDGRGATVEYSCGSRGFGHTTVRMQTPRSATIDTQGMVDGRPFAYRAVARRVGACRPG